MLHKKFNFIKLLAIRLAVYIVIAFIIFAVINFVKAGNIIVATSLLVIASLFVFLSIVLFGRVFCGFVCPLGLLFDVEWKLTQKLHLPKINRNERFMSIMNILSKIFLVFFMCGITSLILLLIFKPSVFSNLSFPLLVIPIIIIFMILLNGLEKRLFCNVCPIGSFIGLFQKLNIIKLNKNSSHCFSCGACYEVCPMKIKSIYTEVKLKDVSSSKCLYCGECIIKCPEDNVLSFNIANKPVYSSSKEEFLKTQFVDTSIKDEEK